MRVDLTEEKLHTLTDGTKAILKKIDGEVELRFYCTRGEDTPVLLKTFASRVEDLLDEYTQHSGGKLVVKRLNPLPLSDAEDSARLDGVQAQRMQTGDQFYLGIAVSFLDATETLPVLSMQREPAGTGEVPSMSSTFRRSELLEMSVRIRYSPSGRFTSNRRVLFELIA